MPLCLSQWTAAVRSKGLLLGSRKLRGFARGFEDLPTGDINGLNTEYFQYLDRTVEILTQHGISTVWQPVFHGYGWKGLPSNEAPPAEQEPCREARFT